MTEPRHHHLLADHLELERRIEEVANAVEGADFPTIDDAWSELERVALAHLDAEEEVLLPRFVHADPEAAAVLLAEHRRIRAGLLNIGVAEQLHMIRKESVDELLDLMRAHREREEESLYAWAEDADEGTLIDQALDSLERLRSDRDRSDRAA